MRVALLRVTRRPEIILQVDFILCSCNVYYNRGDVTKKSVKVAALTTGRLCYNTETWGTLTVPIFALKRNANVYPSFIQMCIRIIMKTAYFMKSAYNRSRFWAHKSRCAYDAARQRWAKNKTKKLPNRRGHVFYITWRSGRCLNALKPVSA